MKGRRWLIALAALLSASNVFGLITRTIGPGKNFSGFDSACIWLKGQSQPLVDDYEFVADPGVYTPCALRAVNTGTRTVTFRPASGTVRLSGFGTGHAFYVESTNNVTLQGLVANVADTAGICYRWSANGVIRDCSMDSTGVYGIYADLSDNLLIDSCIAHNASFGGIYLTQSHNARIRRTWIDNSNVDGIYISWSRDVRVDSSRVDGANGCGIRFYNSIRGRVRFARVTAAGTNTGIMWDLSDTARVDSCFIAAGTYGIYFNNSPASVVRRCSVACSNTGISTSASDRVGVDSSIIWADGQYGINFNSSEGCRVLASSVAGAASDGVSFEHSGHDSIVQCDVANTGSSGGSVRCYSTPVSVGNVVANNLLRGGTWAMIWLVNQDSARFYYNTISGPGAYGIYADSSANMVAKDNIILDSGGVGSYDYFLAHGSSFLPGGSNFNDLPCPPSGQLAYQNGAWYADLAAWKASPGYPDTNSLSTNPLFKGGSDYSLDSASPCKRAGTPIPGITTDLFGNLRHASTPSMGAIEWFPPPPGPFSLLSPTDFSGNQPISGTLLWQRSAGADSYHVYLDTLDPPVYSPGWTTETTLAYGGLKHFYYYYWRITAINPGGSTSSSQFAFQVIIDTPGGFPLRAPADGDTGLSTSGSLYWGISALADSYIVYLDTMNPPVNVLFRRNSLDTTWSYSGLDSGAYYYWQVRAKNVSGITASGIFSFRTAGASVGTFSLLAPADSSEDRPDDVRLRWQKAASADTYVVYLDRNPSPATVVSRQVDTGYDCSGLPADSVYYWKVTAKRNPGSTYTAGPRWFRVAPLPDTIWVPEPQPPVGGKGKAIGDGGALASLPGNGDTTYSFLLKGNNTCEFYVYNSATGAWTTLESIPKVGWSSKKKAVKKGSALVAVGGKIYAFKGNSTNEFWCYTPSFPGPSGIAASGWLQYTDVPGDKKCKDGTSATTVIIDGTPYVYLLKGGTNEFYRNIVTSKGTWETETGAPLPPSGKVYKTGSAIVYYPDDKDGKVANGRIFALKGSYNEFYAYDLLTGSWADKAPMPLMTPPLTKKTKVKAGAGLAYCASPKQILALKGNKTVEYWKYDAGANAWARGVDVPLAPSGKKVGAGGSITCAGGVVSITKGNKTMDFYSLPVSESYGRNPLVEVGGSKTVQTGSETRNAEFGLRVAPTPFTTATTITYGVARSGNVSLRLYDVTGKLVSTLASGYHVTGSYDSQLTADGSQPGLVRGVYLLKYEAGGYRTTQKLVIE